MLKTAAVFHDTGMLKTYVGHEEASVVYARELLPSFDYAAEDLDVIEGLIMATKLQANYLAGMV